MTERVVPTRTWALPGKENFQVFRDYGAARAGRRDACAPRKAVPNLAGVAGRHCAAGTKLLAGETGFELHGLFQVGRGVLCVEGTISQKFVSERSDYGADGGRDEIEG